MCFCLKERNILIVSLLIGIAFLPILFRRPSFKLWSTIYIINGLLSHLMDRILVEKNKLVYPKRLLPKYFKISLVYDYFVCPIITVLYCQSSYYSKLSGTIAKGFLFAVPQIFFEAFSEKNTKLIKYKNGWNALYSYLGIVFVKLMYRGLVEFWKRNSEEIVKN